MKTKIRIFLKRALRVFMAFDRRIVRLLGGRRKFRPSSVDLKNLNSMNGLEVVCVIDRESYKKFQRSSRLSFFARAYISIRNRGFTLAYRLGKRALI